MKAIALGLVAAFALTAAVNQKPADPQLEQFFAAESPADAEKLAASFESFDFDGLYKRLQQGPHLSRREARRVRAAVEVEVGTLFQQHRPSAGGLRTGADVAVALPVHGVSAVRPECHAPGPQPVRERQANRSKGKRSTDPTVDRAHVG